MFKKIAIASMLMSAVGAANAFQAELGGSVYFIDPDHGDSSTGFAIDGTYYFNPVEVKTYPLHEAGFLNRASNVNAAISYTDYDWFERTSFGVGIEYFIPNSDFYLSGSVGRIKVEEDGYSDYDVTSYSAEVGYLPAPGLLIALGLAGYDADDDDDVDPTLRAKYVTQVGAYDMNFEAGAQFGDDNAYTLGTDFYFDKTFSVGVAYSGSDAKGVDDDIFTIRTKKFFTQQFSLEGSVNFQDEGNVFGVRGAYRF
jgi:hypothetical protein